MSLSHLRTPFETLLEREGRFTRVERLGQGGAGLVYRVHDRELGQDVALKTVNAPSAAAIYQIKREFRTLADIRHPNLVVLHELMCIAGEWCFTMELVDGTDFCSYVSEDNGPTGPESGVVLSDRSRLLGRAANDNQRDLKRLLDAFAQLTSGVATLHRADLLHLDLKPGNVLVGDDGRVVVLDFGLARESDSRLTVSEHFAVGTPAYMAPEQVDSSALTPAADWYAVGAMLYEALTGCLPFAGPTLSVLMAKATTDPRPVSELAPHIPPAWSQLCMRLLARNPKERAGYEDIRTWLGEQSSTRAPVATSTGSTAHNMFVGREEVLESLSSAYQAVREGTPRGVFVHGHSGMGKTSAIQEYIRRSMLSDQTFLLEGRCFERESVPYKALDSVIDALSRLLRGMPAVEAAKYVPLNADALVRVFPVLARVPSLATQVRPKGQKRDQQTERDLAFQALKSLLGRLSDDKPVVIFIDDLQWGDRDSGLLVRELLTPPDPPRVLWLGTFRTDEEASSPFLKAIAAHAEDASLSSGIERIALTPLPESHVIQLLRSMLAQEGRDSSAAIALARECDGNPFFAGELARSARRAENNQEDRPAATLESVLLERVRSLPAEQRELIEIVSVIGRPVERSLVMSVAGIAHHGSESFDGLRIGRLVRTRGNRANDLVEPYHDRIREIVGSSLPAERRAELHIRVARELEARSRKDDELLMLHYTEAGVSDRAAHYATQAARNASASLAFDHAARLFRRALSLQPDRSIEELITLNAELGRALEHAGRASDSADAYLRAADKATGRRKIELQLLSAQQLLLCGRYEQGLALLRQTLPEYGITLTTRGTRTLIALLLTRARLALRGLSFKARDESEVDPDLLARIDACYAVATGLGALDSLVAADVQIRGVLMALDAGEPLRVLRALVYESGFRCADTGGAARSHKILMRARELADKLARPEAEGLSEFGTGFYHHHGDGNLLRSKVSFERSEPLLTAAHGLMGELAIVRCSVTTVWDWLGDTVTLMQRMPGLIQDAERRGDQLQLTGLLCAPLFWLSRHALDELTWHVETTRSKWPKDVFVMPSYWFMVAEAQRDVYVGDGQSCLDRIERMWPDLKRSMYLSIPTVRIEVQHPRARAALLTASSGRGDKKALLALAESDIKTLEGSRRAYAHALAATLRCSVAAVRGQDDAVPGLLRQAIAACNQHGLVLFAATARRFLGERIGGDEGRALIAEAEETMRNSNVREPDTLARSLAPGLAR